MASPARIPNPTLAGHKLLTLMTWTPSESWISKIKAKFPGLDIIPVARTDYDGTEMPSQVTPEVLKDVSIMLTYMAFPKSRAQAPKLQYVQLSTAGCNHIMDHPVWKEGGIEFCTASGVHPPQIAEWVICTFLAHQHQLPYYLSAQAKCFWDQPENDEDVDDAVGMKMGILGYGAIGRQIARVATSLGMSIYAYNLRPRPTPESRRDITYLVSPNLGDPEGSLPVEWHSGNPKTPEGSESLNKFLSLGLDVLVLATPLTPSTKHMISKTQFEILASTPRAKSGHKTFISNIGRGPIVNTDDLITALNTDMISGAALDVTDPEPLPADHPLWKAKNCIITPHVSGNSNSYNDRVLGILEYNLTRLSKGEGLSNAVERDVGY